jgi:hypothetical protein
MGGVQLIRWDSQLKHEFCPSEAPQMHVQCHKVVLIWKKGRLLFLQVEYELLCINHVFYFLHESYANLEGPPFLGLANF